jgi:hypothetical protein
MTSPKGSSHSMGKECCARILKERDSLFVVHLAEVLDSVAEPRAYLCLEVRQFLGVPHLARNPERSPRLPGNRDRPVASLAGMDPPQEEEVVVPIGGERQGVQIDAVGAVGDPGEVRGRTTLI